MGQRFYGPADQVKQEQQKQKVKLLDDKAFAGIQALSPCEEPLSAAGLRRHPGTLFTDPSEAAPDNAVRDLLTGCLPIPKIMWSSSAAGTSSLDRWLGGLPLTLVAEHGASFKMRNAGWQQMVSVSDLWKDEIRRVMQLFVLRCAGSFVEEKTNTLAWHYRNTQTGLGFSRPGIAEYAVPADPEYYPAGDRRQ
jgi:trehalose 6-phosphate synthase/phosphatase